jgi:hypothetical protein
MFRFSFPLLKTAPPPQKNSVARNYILVHYTTANDNDATDDNYGASDI